MLTRKKKIGDYGQRLAADFLIKRGYQLLAENYFCSRGEIDLIAKQGEQLVFVEVKTRLSADFGRPEEAVDKVKITKLSQAILCYLADRQIKQDNYRLDCLAIEIDKVNKKAQIRHYKAIG